MKRLLILLLLLATLLVPAAGRALTIEEGLKIVSETGRDVKIAESNEAVARGSVSLARSAWMPQVNAYGNETWLKYQPMAKFTTGVNTAIVPTSQDQFLSYGVTANQLLYDFGKTSSSIDAAQYSLKAREIETRRARNLSSLNFILAYYDLLEADKLVIVAAEEVKQYEAHKHDAEVRLSAGVVTRNEVLQADVALADSRQRFLVADNNRSLCASRINSLLIRPLNESVQVEEVTASPSAGITLDAAWTVSEEESPEIQVIDASIRAQQESVKAVRSEYLPTLFLSGGYQYQENEYQVHPGNWSLIAGATFNLFAGGATDARVHINASELAGLRTTRDKIVDAVRLEVKGAYLNLQSSAQQIEVTRTAVAQAVENLRLQRLRYQEGVGTATEVLDAVTLLTSTQTGKLRAQYGFNRAEAGLLYSMGKDLTGMYMGAANTSSEVPKPESSTPSQALNPQ
jgi:outer membrane protein